MIVIYYLFIIICDYYYRLVHTLIEWCRPGSVYTVAMATSATLGGRRIINNVDDHIDIEDVEKKNINFFFFKRQKSALRMVANVEMD